MDDEPRERHLNIHFSPEIMAGVYANFANVSHSDYEFTVTFARESVAAAAAPHTARDRLSGTVDDEQ